MHLNIEVMFLFLTLCDSLKHSVVFFFFWILWWLVIAHDIPNSFWHFVTTTLHKIWQWSQIFSRANLHLPFQEYICMWSWVMSSKANALTNFSHLSLQFEMILISSKHFFCFLVWVSFRTFKAEVWPSHTNYNVGYTWKCMLHRWHLEMQH
jgi:hypothetical protein